MAKQIVVINPKKRCIKLQGIRALVPGRNLRDAAMVEKAMQAPTAKALGLVCVKPSKPEKLSAEKAIAEVHQTFELDALKDLLASEQRPNVKKAIEAQIALLTETEKPKDDDESDDGEDAGEGDEANASE